MGNLRRLLVSAILVVLVSAGEIPLTLAQPDIESAPAQSGWQVFPNSNTASMYTIDMVDATNGWLGGTGGLLMRFDGMSWIEAPCPLSDAITGLDIIDGGTGFGITYQGHVIQYNGSTWVETANLTQGVGSLTGISILDATDGWAVGFLGGIYRYQAGNWFEAAKVSYMLQAIDMIAPDDGWAVGRTGSTLHWNGYYWATVGEPQNVWFLDVDMVNSNDGWAVGDGGAIYHYNGSIWSPVASPTDELLRGVHMTDAGNGWAVGENGTILHYTGGTWQLVDSPTDLDLHALYMVSANEGWAVGKKGTILHYVAAPDLSSSVLEVSAPTAGAGDTLTYTIHVRNSGNAVASGVVVTDTIPLHTVYVPGSATSSQGTIQGPDPLRADLGDLSPGAEVTISFQVTVDDPGTECWFVYNQALIRSGDMEHAFRVLTVVGESNKVYLPALQR